MVSIFERAKVIDESCKRCLGTGWLEARDRSTGIVYAFICAYCDTASKLGFRGVAWNEQAAFEPLLREQGVFQEINN